jgi:flavin-dependent dehydrogenase
LKYIRLRRHRTPNDRDGCVIGVATGDMGVTRSGEPGPAYQRGMALLGKYVLIGEGARGSLAKELIRRFHLDADCEPPKFGIGLKEIWEWSQAAPARAGAAFLRVAARDAHRRRLVPLPFRREPGFRRLRRAPQLREPVPLAL